MEQCMQCGQPCRNDIWCKSCYDGAVKDIKTRSPGLYEAVSAQYHRRLAEEQAEQRATQQANQKSYLLQSIFLIPYFLITSLVAISLFTSPVPSTLSTGFAFLFCTTSAVLNWIDRMAPVRMHLAFLFALGLFKWFLMLFV